LANNSRWLQQGKRCLEAIRLTATCNHRDRGVIARLSQVRCHWNSIAAALQYWGQKEFTGERDSLNSQQSTGGDSMLKIYLPNQVVAMG